MRTNEQIAREYFTSGYNCAQSVFLTYAEKYGFDKETALKLSSSFGGGMGRMREVCGAISAMFMIAGLENGYTENNNDEIKAEHYTRIQNLANEFKKKNGTIICRELLGVDADDNPIPSKRTSQYYEERPCEELIADACKIIDEFILKKGG
jgi:C_GCAxxG_C_C family probable redox protein